MWLAYKPAWCLMLCGCAGVPFTRTISSAFALILRFLSPIMATKEQVFAELADRFKREDIRFATRSWRLVWLPSRSLGSLRKMTQNSSQPFTRLLRPSSPTSRSRKPACARRGPQCARQRRPVRTAAPTSRCRWTKRRCCPPITWPACARPCGTATTSACLLSFWLTWGFIGSPCFTIFSR